jgi:tripartite-type tricarboxylate transporter receptor subunit TctC
MNELHRARRLLIAGLMTAVTSNVAMAQTPASWPTKPIRLVVPFPAGTGADVVGRLLSDQLAKQLGQPVVVDNKAGAAGMIGAEEVAKSRPDGYTVLMAVNSFMTMNPHIYRKMRYDALKDFSPVMQLTSASYVLITGPASPLRSMNGLIDAAKANPGKIEFASLGAGSATHVIMEHAADLAGIKLHHVPFKTTGLTEVMSGLIPIAFEPIATAVPVVSTGKVRALAVTSPKRASVLPDVPAMSEFLSGFNGDGWHAVVVPAGTPGPIIERLHRELKTIMALPQIQERFASLGLSVVAGTPEELDRTLRSDHAKWGQVIRKASISID